MQFRKSPTPPNFRYSRVILQRLKIIRSTYKEDALHPEYDSIGMALQLEVCKEQVEWAKSEKRTFLRQRIEARLANLYLDTKDYSAALSLISRLLSEVGCSTKAD